MSEKMYEALEAQTERARKLLAEKDQLSLNLAILQNNFEELLGAYRDAVCLYDPNTDSGFTTLMHNALAASRSALPHNAMDWPIPCDLAVGNGTITKGCKFSVVQARMKALFDLSQDLFIQLHGDRITLEAPALRPEPRY